MRLNKSALSLRILYMLWPLVGYCLDAQATSILVNNSPAGSASHSQNSSSSQTFYQQEVKRLTVIFRHGDYAAIHTATKELQWSGISDPALYNVIYQRLRPLLSANTREAANEAVWLIRGLSYSGLHAVAEKLLDGYSITQNKKLKKHITEALRQLPQYRHWNRLIAENVNTSTTPNRQRLINMIASEDAELMRVAARSVYRKQTPDQIFYATAAKTLLEIYARLLTSQQEEAAAWLCRLLEKSLDPTYLTVARTVATETPNRKLRNYAEDAMKTLNKQHHRLNRPQ